MGWSVAQRRPEGSRKQLHGRRSPQADRRLISALNRLRFLCVPPPSKKSAELPVRSSVDSGAWSPPALWKRKCRPKMSSRISPPTINRRLGWDLVRVAAQTASPFSQLTSSFGRWGFRISRAVTSACSRCARLRIDPRGRGEPNAGGSVRHRDRLRGRRNLRRAAHRAAQPACGLRHRKCGGDALAEPESSLRPRSSRSMPMLVSRVRSKGCRDHDRGELGRRARRLPANARQLDPPIAGVDADDPRTPRANAGRGCRAPPTCPRARHRRERASPLSSAARARVASNSRSGTRNEP